MSLGVAEGRSESPCRFAPAEGDKILPDPPLPKEGEIAFQRRGESPAKGGPPGAIVPPKKGILSPILAMQCLFFSIAAAFFPFRDRVDLTGTGW